MTLEDFLIMHNGGCCQNCVTIQRLPYEHDRHRYAKTYFEEECQDNILASTLFDQIADSEVDHFCIIGGGMYPMELSIFLTAE